MLAGGLTVGPPLNITKSAANEAETSISVNPNNTNALFEIDTNTQQGRYSSDGGLSWNLSNMAGFAINDNPASVTPFVGDTQTAWDRFGNLFLTQFGAGDDVEVGISTDGGASFTVKTVPGSTKIDQPSIAVGPSGVVGTPGAVWVSYAQGGTIQASGAAVNGLGLVGAFSAPETAPGSTNGDFGDVSIGPAGQVLVTYQDGLAPGAPGGEGPGTISTNLDPDGLGPAGFNAAITAHSTNVGGTTSVPPQPGPFNVGGRTIDAEANLGYDNSGGPHNGRVYMVYTDRSSVPPPANNNTDIFVIFSDNNGTTWSNPVRVNDDPSNGTMGATQYLPAIAVDQTTGFVAVSWYDTRNSGTGTTRDTYASVSVDGGVHWAPNVRLSAALTNPLANGTFDSGDWDKMTFANGVFYRSWSDNSNSTNDNPAGAGGAFDAYTARVSIVDDTVSVDNSGNLIVTGNATANDDISIKIVGTSYQIHDTNALVVAGNGPVQSVDANTVSIPVAAVTGGIFVTTGAGNNTLTVDSSGGLIAAPNGIHYDGGTGFSKLRLTQTGGATQTSDTYRPGPNPGEGTDTITTGGTTQTVFFKNLAPVQDNVPATTATVNGTPANNAINYTQGPGGGIFVGNTGFVTVDNQESYEFNNKTDLVINGLGGSDTINLNYTNPVPPAGLTGIGINSNDPTPGPGDTLIVNANTTAAQGITFAPTGPKTGSITGTGLTTPVNFMGGFQNVAQVNINGNAENDTLTVTTPAADTATFNPGATIDSGSVQVDSVVPMSYTNLGATGGVSLSDAGGTFVYNGTPGNDTFTVAATTGAVTLNSQLAITPAAGNIPATLTLNGLEGLNTFNVTGPQPYTTTNLNSNDTTDTDPVNLTGNGTAVTVNLGTTSNVTGGGLGTVNLPGDAVLNLSDGAGAITINGPGNDAFTVSPTTASSATTQAAGLAPVVNTTNTGTLTIDPGTGTNSVTVNGTSASETIGVVRGSPTTVTVGALKTISLVTADTQALVVDTGLGTDTVNVSGTSGPASLTVNGGANPRADTLNVTNSTAGTTTVTPGATPDAGTVAAPGTDGSVAFTGMSSISVTAAGAAAANTITGIGPNGNDTLFLQHIGAATPGGTDRFWVNNQAPTTFSGFGTVDLTGLFGNDQFNVNPIGLAAAVTAINVKGTSTGNSLVVNGSAAADAINFSPTGPAAGSVAFTTPAGVATTTFTTIQGVTINGQGGNDTLTVTTPAGSNVVNLTPGALADEGTVTLRQFVAAGGGSPLAGLSFVNLGTDNGLGRLSFANTGGTRTDNLTINGVANASEIFTVSSTGNIDLSQPTAVSGTLNRLLLNVATPGVSQLQLVGLAQNNTFNVAGNHPFTAGVFVDGDPGIVNFTGDGTAAVTADLGAGTVTETGFGPVAYTGVGTANLSVGGNALTILGTAGPDSLTYTPTGAAAGTLTDAGINTVFNFSTVTGTFTLDPLGGTNTVTVAPTSTSSVINVIRGAADSTVQVDALQTLSVVTADTQALVVNTGPGAAVVFVSGGGANGMILTIQANTQIAPDVLRIKNAHSGTTLIVPTGAPEAGTIYTPDGRVIYAGMNVVNLLGTGAGDTLQVNATNVSDQIEAQSVGGVDQVVLNTLGILNFFTFGNLDLVGEFGNDQLKLGAMPGINVVVTGGGGESGGGGFFNTINLEPGTQPVTVLPTSIQVQGSPPITFNGITLLNILFAEADVSLLVRLVSMTKKHLSKHKLKLHLTLQNLSSLALGGPLLLILEGLTGGARVVGGGLTTRLSPAGVGQPWMPVFDGNIPRLFSGQEVSVDVVIQTTHNSVAFNPFAVIAGILP
jgi:hypothetical protein